MRNGSCKNWPNCTSKEIERTVSVVGSVGDFARYFEQGATLAWESSHEYNMTFLKIQQNYANQLLRGHGYLFLNEVYEMLGFPKTKAGQFVGWVYDPDNTEKYNNDNHVDFRIQEIRRIDDNDPEGIVETILLDFNVDGGIVEHASDKQLI